MLDLLVSLLILAAPLSASGKGHHYGWRNRQTVPAPFRPPATQVVPPEAGSGPSLGASRSDAETPGPRMYAE